MKTIEKLLKKHIKNEEVRNEIIERIFKIKDKAFNKAKKFYSSK